MPLSRIPFHPYQAHFENAVRVPVCDNPATDLDGRERVGICKQ